MHLGNLREMVNLRVACSFVAEVFVLLLRTVYCYGESLYRCVVPPRQKDIRGKVTVVTGGGSGIGRALATRFADSGACVAVWDINKVCRLLSLFNVAP